MNKRYFLRGLGCGLIIGAIVMMVALSSQDKNEASTATPSDASKTASADIQKSDTETEEPTVEPTTKSETIESTTEPEPLVTTESEPEPSTDSSTEEKTDTSTEATTEATSEAVTASEKGGSVTVTAGMSAQSVARKLHNIGVIDDEEDFYMYMYNNGYASKILQGTFTFTGDEDYEEISKILTNTR